MMSIPCQSCGLKLHHKFPCAPVPDVLFVGTHQILIAAAGALCVQAKIPQFANLSFY